MATVKGCLVAAGVSLFVFCVGDRALKKQMIMEWCRVKILPPAKF
jgi:hypothetical protein